MRVTRGPVPEKVLEEYQELRSKRESWRLWLRAVMLLGAGLFLGRVLWQVPSVYAVDVSDFIYTAVGVLLLLVALCAVLWGAFYAAVVPLELLSARSRWRVLERVLRRQHVLIFELSAAQIYRQRYAFLMVDRSGAVVVINSVGFFFDVFHSIHPIETYTDAEWLEWNRNPVMPKHFLLTVFDDPGEIYLVECFGPLIPVDVFDRPIPLGPTRHKSELLDFRSVRPEELPVEWRERVHQTLPHA